MVKKQLMGIIGALLLIIGVFIPMLSFPFFGGISFINSSKAEGGIVIILAIMSIVLVIAAAAIKNNEIKEEEKAVEVSSIDIE